MESTQDRLLDLSLRLFRPDWPWPVRYGLAVVFTLAIAGLKLSIPAFGAPGPDLFLTIPVAASAVLAGFAQRSSPSLGRRSSRRTSPRRSALPSPSTRIGLP